MPYTTQETFLQIAKGGTITLPNGKEIYILSIVSKKIRLRALIAVVTERVVYSGPAIGTVTKAIIMNPGELTGVIDNAFYNTSLGKVCIEWQEGNINGVNYIRRAILRPENFDLSPLQNVPSVATIKAEANQMSTDANESHRLDNTSFLNQVVHSITGIDSSTLLYAGVGIAALIFLTRRK